MIRLWKPLSPEEARRWASEALQQEHERGGEPAFETYRAGCTLGAASRAEAQRRCQLPEREHFHVVHHAVPLPQKTCVSSLVGRLHDASLFQLPPWVQGTVFAPRSSAAVHGTLPPPFHHHTVLVLASRHLLGLVWVHGVLVQHRKSASGCTWRCVPRYHLLRGEESMYVRRDGRRRRWHLGICSASAPANLLALLTLPYVRWCQDRFVRQCTARVMATSSSPLSPGALAALPQ